MHRVWLDFSEGESGEPLWGEKFKKKGVFLLSTLLYFSTASIQNNSFSLIWKGFSSAIYPNGQEQFAKGCAPLQNTPPPLLSYSAFNEIVLRTPMVCSKLKNKKWENYWAMPWKTTDNCFKSITDRICNYLIKKEEKKKVGKLYNEQNSFVTALSFKTTNTVTHSKTQHVPHSKYLLLACIPTEDKQ